MSSLMLTSPRIKDEETGNTEVKDAQDLLAKNKFGEFYSPDEPQHRDEEGVFGKWTAEACYWARYWLGYEKKGKDGYRRRRYDDELESYLNGTKALTSSMKRRRKRRLDKTKATYGQKALEFAKKQIGEHEVPGGSNRCATTQWYGFSGAWCLMFVTRCYVEGAGSKVFKQGSRWAYNPTMYHAVRADIADAGFVPLSKAEPGDVVQLDLNNGTEPPDHACLYVKMDGDYVVTLDGNWGDKVDYQKHHKSTVMDVVRITG